MPAPTCLLTTSATADRMRASSADGSTGTPSSLANIIRIRSAGRGRLPVCVVRNRSVLRFIGRIVTDTHARRRARPTLDKAEARPYKGLGFHVEGALARSDRAVPPRRILVPRPCAVAGGGGPLPGAARGRRAGAGRAAAR